MTLIRNRKGFSLIELMIVIAIIGILVAVALPQFAAMTEDAKKTKAKQDCDTICQAIQKYNSLEGTQVEQLMDLKGKYLTNIDTLRDPWGNAYQIDVFGGYVYSKGPDGQDGIDASTTPPSLNDKDKRNNDNIRVPYIGALTIVKAQIEVNPAGEADATLATDVLHLFFNKRVKVSDKGVDFTLTDTNAPSENAISGKAADNTTAAFRWCEGSKNRYVAAPVATKATSADKCWAGGHELDADGKPTDYEKYYWTEDSREIVVVLAQGETQKIIPGTHFINLTCNRKNVPPAVAEDRNPVFKEFNGTSGGEMSGTPIKIEVYE